MSEHVFAHGKDKNKKSQTGLPDLIKNSAERLSGYALDDTRVHYNSPKPDKMGAYAYTYGNEIHIAPQQEKYLPHELGHVIQQKQGRVHATDSLGGIGLNSDSALEHEADTFAEHIFVQKASEDNIAIKGAIAKNPVMQRALKVCVSLIQTDEPVSKQALRVDTIGFSGRSDTGLRKNTANNPTQGDHTLADIFVKKHQQVYLRNRTYSSALSFYRMLFYDVKQDNAGYIPPETNTTLYPKATDDFTDYIGRKSRSINLSDRGLALITQYEPEVALTPSIWRKILTDIAYYYNDAYALSPLAAGFKDAANKGHGEQAGINSVKKSIYSKDYTEDASPLFDATAVDQIAGAMSSTDGVIPKDAVKKVLTDRAGGMLSRMKQGYQKERALKNLERHVREKGPVTINTFTQGVFGPVVSSMSMADIRNSLVTLAFSQVNINTKLTELEGLIDSEFKKLLTFTPVVSPGISPFSSGGPTFGAPLPSTFTPSPFMPSPPSSMPLFNPLVSLQPTMGMPSAPYGAPTQLIGIDTKALMTDIKQKVSFLKFTLINQPNSDFNPLITNLKADCDRLNHSDISAKFNEIGGTVTSFTQGSAEIRRFLVIPSHDQVKSRR